MGYDIEADGEERSDAGIQGCGILMWFDFKKNNESGKWVFRIGDGIYESSFEISKDEMTSLSVFLKMEGF